MCNSPKTETASNRLILRRVTVDVNILAHQRKSFNEMRERERERGRGREREREGEGERGRGREREKKTIAYQKADITH